MHPSTLDETMVGMAISIYTISRSTAKVVDMLGAVFVIGSFTQLIVIFFDYVDPLRRHLLERNRHQHPLTSVQIRFDPA
jgi:hypothetical protein